jgi:hypothetical protein
LGYLEKAGCFGALATGNEFAGLGDPFDLVWGVVDRTVEMLHYLWGFDCVHLVLGLFGWLIILLLIIYRYA